MYLIKLEGEHHDVAPSIVYACTDPVRFAREAAKWAWAPNASFELEIVADKSTSRHHA